MLTCVRLLRIAWVRNFAAWMVENVMKDKVLPGTVRAASSKPVHEFHKWVQQRDDYARMFHREVSRRASSFAFFARPRALP